jgi:hypothetical protein
MDTLISLKVTALGARMQPGSFDGSNAGRIHEIGDGEPIVPIDLTRVSLGE